MDLFPGVLKDALHNASLRETNHFNFFEDLNRGQIYGRGMVVGVVALFMAWGLTFEAALKATMQYLPLDTDRKCIPECWHTQYDGIRESQDRS